MTFDCPSVDEAISQYMSRMGLSVHDKDALFQAQWAWTREIVRLADLVMEDHGVDHMTRHAVVRGILYGSPSEAVADERVRLHEQYARLLSETATPDPVVLSSLFMREGRDAGT